MAPSVSSSAGLAQENHSSCSYSLWKSGSLIRIQTTWLSYSFPMAQEKLWFVVYLAFYCCKSWGDLFPSHVEIALPRWWFNEGILHFMKQLPVILLCFTISITIPSNLFLHPSYSPLSKLLSHTYWKRWFDAYLHFQLFHKSWIN
jgi:hypothetical protein